MKFPQIIEIESFHELVDKHYIGCDYIAKNFENIFISELFCKELVLYAKLEFGELLAVKEQRKLKAVLLVSFFDVKGDQLNNIKTNLNYSEHFQSFFSYIVHTHGMYNEIVRFSVPDSVTSIGLKVSPFIDSNVLYSTKYLYYQQFGIKNSSIKKNIVILGSCVTRDIFNNEELAKNVNLKKYFARSSVASVMSNQKLPTLLEDIKLDSSFQKNCVYSDLNKSFCSYILANKHNIDYIILDFIDERFGLFEIFDSNYITASDELIKSEVIHKFNADKVKPIAFEESFKIKITALFKFISFIISNNLQGKVLIHKAFWSIQCINNGVIEHFSINSQREINRQNILLDILYKILEDNNFTMVFSEVCFADANHKWSLTPYHYDQLYNSIIVQKIMRLLKVY